jgi:hypothetical protein
MSASHSVAVQVALAVALVILTAYAAGRVHQWYRHGFERDVAYRDGYNQASRTLFHLAIRHQPSIEQAPDRLPLARLSGKVHQQ